MLGRRFLHPKLGFAFEAPDGFALENQSAALIGVGESGAQALRLDSASRRATRPRSRARSPPAGSKACRPNSIETLKDADLPMAVAVAQGQQWSFRLGAIRLDGRIYRLIFAAHSLAPAVDARFLASIRSFHRITPAEAAEARPSRLQIVAAQRRRNAADFRRAHGGEPRAARTVPHPQRARDKASTTPAGERFKIVTQMTSQKTQLARIVAATHNKGKLVEIRELLGPHGLEVVGAGALGLPEPEETGDTSSPTR